ncbi:unnamed protein product [Onchocerca flexuosa]|uniref:Uncharacterized protein n=1 Tax=Onchocerca flexuosa TaxID=387005 RepID=A0A183HWT8_9BILA|nr:unnamed protein product [Onchocerca flexuosa]
MRLHFIHTVKLLQKYFNLIIHNHQFQVAELDLDNPIRSQRKLRGCTFKNGERLEPTDRVVGFTRPDSHLHSARKLQMPRCCSNRAIWKRSEKVEKLGSLLENIEKLRNLLGNVEKLGILLGLNVIHQGYLAFYLYRGYLVVHLGTDSSQKSKVLTLRSEATYNDGQLHSIFFTRFETLLVSRQISRLFKNNFKFN